MSSCSSKMQEENRAESLCKQTMAGHSQAHGGH